MEDYGLLGIRPSLLDIWHGWSLGLGTTDSQQGVMAIDFYNAVVDDLYGTEVHGNDDSINISLTGHSLGGGLAGFVGSLYDQDACVFDSMSFGLAVELANGGSDTDIFETIYGSTNLEDAWNPDYVGISGYYVEGEVLDGLQPWRSAAPGPLDLGSVTDELGGVQKHSMSMMVIRLFADVGSDAGGALDTGWRTSGQYFWPVMFQEGFATAIGAKDAAALTTMIAYSALDGGNLIYGDTGVRALYDDANDFGKAVTNVAATNAIMSFTEEISKVFVQYAGELALHKAANDNVWIERKVAA
jgi:hypothetical protein